MHTNRKFTYILLIMLSSLLLATLVTVGFTLRSQVLNAAVEKARLGATFVEDGLTSHMVNGTMDKREYFLDRITRSKEIDKLWLVRADAVKNQFGEGIIKERNRDEIDEKVLKTGKSFEKINDTLEGTFLRITIPYTATTDEDGTSCMSCHNVSEGDVLGAISMTFNITDVRNIGIITLAKFLLVSIIFMTIAMYLTNRYLTPYAKFIENLEEGVGMAYKGDFSYHFPKTLNDGGEKVTNRLNHLFEKMHDTFGQIKNDLSTFITHSKQDHDDPLLEAHNIIKELSDVYKFKKTIEIDKSKNEIYGRLCQIIENKFGVKEFSLYETNKKNNTRDLVFDNSKKEYCILPTDIPSDCRAYRSNSIAISTDFDNLCEFCDDKETQHICIPIDINTVYTITLILYTQDDDTLKEYQGHAVNIENYFYTAKPVIESHILMDQLRDSSLRDGMTGLYNRRFLEEFIDKAQSQALRTDQKYSIMMIDIDFFKLVNDEYGHDVGDKVIKGLSEVLISSIRSADLAIRYGGEEFVIMLHNSDLKGSERVAEDIRTKFSELKFDLDKTTLQKTLSVGVSIFPDHTDSMWKAIKYADTALYEAKNSGRNKVVIYNDDMFEYED